mgnify:CR=1 FL=1
MGTFLQPIEIGDPQGQRYERVEALVGTRASYTVLPASLLSGLGVKPIAQRPFELSDGKIINLPIGQTWIRVDGESGIRIVVFSPEEVYILGAETLSGFLLEVDPLGKRLVPVEGLLM